MIHIIFGPGGAGKSRYQIELIVEQLRTTKRNVVTNLAINVPALADYLQRLYPTESHDVYRRVVILSREEATEFWKYRGRLRWVGPDACDYELDRGEFGVCYVIDEAGACGFNAVGWATSVGRSTRGEEASWYLDQQRKFGDDVFASTNGRAPHGIAKPFRDKAHYFIKLRNEYLATYGVFRGRGRFVAKWYQTEPDRNAEPIRTVTFGVDAQGLAACYFTEHGMGVAGSSADKGARAKGISIWWAVAAAFALVSLVGIVPYALGKVAGHYVGGGASKKSSEGRPKPVRSTDAFLVGGAARPAGEAMLGADNVPIYVDYYVAAPGRVTVKLTNGRVITEADGVIKEVTRRYVELRDGTRYPLRNPLPSPVATPPGLPAFPSAPSADSSRSSDDPKPRDMGSWVLGSDGVMRLKDSATLGVGKG